MNKFFVSIIFYLTSISLFAQNQAVTGWVFDKKTLETIPSAIIVDNSSNIYSESNNKGYYQIVSKYGEHDFVFAAPGYKALKVKIDVSGIVLHNVFLEPTDFDEEGETEIYTSLYSSKTSYYKTLPRQVIQDKTMFGISDPIKILQNLPGVSGGFEGLSSTFVRGSNADQNLLLMNGLPLYGNGHIWGLLSNYNPEIMKSSEFYRGVAPARFGNRANGGVLDITTLGGSAESWKGIVNVDLAMTNIAVNGPIDEAGRWTASLGMRRTYIDLLIASIAPDFSNLVVGNVHDINFNLTFKQNSKTHWDYWIYNGRDKYGLGFSDDVTDSLGRKFNLDFDFGWVWQNTLTGFNYSHEINIKHFMTLSAGISRYVYFNQLYSKSKLSTDSTSEINESLNQDKNSITDYSITANFDYLMGPKTHLKYGSNLVIHDMRPGELKEYEMLSNVITIDTVYGIYNNSVVTEFSNYAELEYHPDLNLSLNIGARLWSYFSKDNTFVRIEPRITINQMLQGNRRIQLGFSLANQGIHQLSSVTGILPQDVWFPTTGRLKPQQTLQASAAYIQPLSKGFELTIEGYYKYLNGITEVQEERDEKLSQNYWENMVSQGVGNSQGIELLITKRTGQLNLIGSYTYSITTRTFEDVNFGENYNFRWDRRHKFNLQMAYQATESLVLNFNLVLMSGNPVTVPTSRYFTTDGRLVYDYSEKNNYRLPTYRRLDLGFTKEIKPESHIDYREFYGVHIYNILAFSNPMVARFQQQPINGFNPLIGTSYFNFVPSAFYRIEF
jgi:hypothetical protein